MPHRKKYLSIIFLLFLLVIFFFLLDIFIGSISIPLKEIFKILLGGGSIKSTWETIILEIRLPKAITAVCSGLALSLSGVQMQTLFRNPLAGPYVLGISSGASLGVALLILGVGSTGLFYNILDDWTIIISAWVGAGAVLSLVFLVSLYISNITTILILGIMFGSAISAIVNILQYFSNEMMLKSYIIWTMGSLSGVTSEQLYAILLPLIIGIFISFALAKPLNAFLLGEKYSQSMGINFRSTRIWIMLSTTILAGTITAFCGPIAFVGISVPHICRFIFKTSDHRLLIPASMLVGSIFMLISDIISHLPCTDGRSLPINSITALFGAPVVISVILQNRKNIQ